MINNFIEKLKAKGYLIGSFDAYIDSSKNIIKTNSNLEDEEVESVLKSMPTTYRASIINENNEYIGYIGLYNVDSQNNSASIRFEVEKSLKEDDKTAILDEFKKYLYDALNITNINEFIYIDSTQKEIEKKEILPKTNIIITNNFLEPGIDEKVLEKYSSIYSVPNLQMSFTIKSNDRVIGIIGLSNIIWVNKRANLNIFLDKELGSDIVNELSGYIINDYVNYVHNSNIHSITLSVNGSDENMKEILKNTNMNYYGQIPYAAIMGDNIESNFMYQHIPNMKKQNGIYIPNNISKKISTFDTSKKELDDIIEFSNGFKLIKPSMLEQNRINSETVLQGHINAMKNREGYTIPLGEDKYFLQKGNKIYGISKAFGNYSYLLLDENNKYAGYINIIRNNAQGKNAEIEVGIIPNLQKKGLGTMVVNKFYDELFKIGYASVTSAVFDFNTPSIKLHEKVAQLNGIRLESYYINGKLWNMNFYSKINEVEEKKYEKHI